MQEPDFVVVGAMKAGTTTLHRWLDSHPAVRLPAVKELNLLNQPGLSDARAYFEHFADLRIGGALVTGEASPAYLVPPATTLVAQRLAAWTANTRVLVLLRDPVQRAISHYMHEVLRSREKRSPVDALADRESAYVRASEYRRCLQPYVDAGLGERLHVLIAAELFGDGGQRWEATLLALGLDPIPRPEELHNASDSKGQFTPLMRRVFDRDLHRHAAVLPSSLRRIAKRALIRKAPSIPSPDAVHPGVREHLRADSVELESLLPVHLPWLHSADVHP